MTSDGGALAHWAEMTLSSVMMQIFVWMFHVFSLADNNIEKVRKSKIVTSYDPTPKLKCCTSLNIPSI